MTKFLVIFQATSQFSLKFCINFQCHDIQFLWSFLTKTIHFGQKEPIKVKVQIFRFFSALMKVHPIRHASFKTTSSRFIQILHQSSVSWKISHLYFFISSIYTSQKEPIESNFQTFQWLGENSPSSLCHVWNYRSVFL